MSIKGKKYLFPKEAKNMEYIFDSYYKPLILWAASFINDIDKAEDIVQELFTEIWENNHNLNKDTLKSYLYTSVKNRAIDFIRKKDPLKGAERINLFDRSWEEYDNFKDEALSKINEEIEKLPKRTKQVIQCIYLRGMSYKETASHLNVSTSTVNTLLTNAIKKIREISLNSNLILLFMLLKEEEQ